MSARYEWRRLTLWWQTNLPLRKIRQLTGNTLITRVNCATSTWRCGKWDGFRQAESLGLQIWDTSGQEGLRSLRNITYPDTDIFLMAYDMTRKNTLENVVAHDLNDMASYELPDPDDYEQDEGGWMSEVTAGCESDFHIILVGCKADYWEELNASGTPEQKAELTTWQQGYDVPTAPHLCFDAFA